MEKITKVDEEFQDLIATLPVAAGWLFESQYLYKGFWYPPAVIRGILMTEFDERQQRETAATAAGKGSILLASCPKAGTTWAKSLLFAITNRGEYPSDSSIHPLLTLNPHECFTFVESYDINNNNNNNNDVLHKSLLSTHLPFSSLPDSLKSSSRRIVYVYRDPKDVLISLMQFSNQIQSSNESSSSSVLSMEEAVDLFCEGKSYFGPYWDQVLTYWEQSLKTPGRILLVSYEDLKSNPIDCLNKLASFVEHPFSSEEEKSGVPENIVDLCSFNKLKDLEVNQPTSIIKAAEDINIKIPNSLFFRKGEVGDYRNHLTQEMIHRIDNITKQKFGDIASFLLP